MIVLSCLFNDVRAKDCCRYFLTSNFAVDGDMSIRYERRDSPSLLPLVRCVAKTATEVAVVGRQQTLMIKSSAYWLDTYDAAFHCTLYTLMRLELVLSKPLDQ